MLDDLYQRQRRQLTATPVFTWPGLQGWSFYFIGKAVLALLGSLTLLGIWNAAFIAVLVVPLPNTGLRALRQLFAIPAALVLLYAESHLPPFSRLIAQWEQVSQFSWSYLLELIERLVPLETIAVVMVAWIVYLYIRRVLRMTVISVMLVVLAVWLQAPLQRPLDIQPQVSRQAVNPVGAAQPNMSATDPDAILQAFYRQQSRVLERPIGAPAAEIDIIVINICSLSWQDLRTYNLADHAFLRRQDIIFDQYTSGSSYSGPAALRLLRANCGHVPHDKLYEATNNQCFLTESLAELGYNSQLVLNHTGEFDNFKTLLQEHGGFAGLPVTVASNAPQTMVSFDGTPVYDDLSILTGLVDQAKHGATQQQFTFYNTISLHDGNRLVSAAKANGGGASDSARSYPQRLRNLLDELNSFYDYVKASGRPTLVVIAPEHGSGLQGDSMQLPGVREIPTPALTKVPVMIRLIAPNVERSTDTPVLVSEPLGPTAVSSTIYEILAQHPVASQKLDLEAAVRSLPQRPYVAENEDVKVMEHQLELWLKIENQDWMVYPGAR